MLGKHVLSPVYGMDVFGWIETFLLGKIQDVGNSSSLQK